MMLHVAPLSACLYLALITSVAAVNVQEGVDLLRANKFVDSNAIFYQATKEGSAEAMYYLGQSYVRGRGIEKNPEAGLQLLLRAYELPSKFKGKAAYELGRIFQVIASHRDYKKAHDWFWASLESGYGKAHVQLFELYDRGLGVKANQKQALYHLKHGAQLGYPQSMLAYARRLANGNYGQADQREIDGWTAKAIKVLERQARRGSATACVRLGKTYIAGDLVEVDEDKARKWFKKGRKLGSALAKRYLKIIGD
ncbi:MAG: SEL1-like repeat protein [Magnetovibrio sp.]|nr:SEL1-like repeat protein [Magnetovibrio sp.]